MYATGGLKKFFRVMALLLAVASVVGLLPLSALADEARKVTKTDEALSVNAENTANRDAALDSALNVTNGTLQFTNDTSRPWTVDSTTFSGRVVGVSGNYQVSSSSSTVSTTISMTAGDTLKFDWNTEGEGSTYDLMQFFVNNTSTTVATLASSSSGTEKGWQTYTYTASSTGSYTFYWRYKKDRLLTCG